MRRFGHGEFFLTDDDGAWRIGDKRCLFTPSGLMREASFLKVLFL